MKIALGILGSFFVTVFFLSIEVRDRTIFGHIYKVISPATTYVQDGVEDFFGSSYKKTHRYSKKLFENSTPNLRDSVRSKMSAHQKAGAPSEEIHGEEKEELDELIKSHR